MKSQEPKNGNSQKFKDEQMTSDLVRQHFKMAIGRPIPQGPVNKGKPGK